MGAPPAASDGARSTSAIGLAPGRSVPQPEGSAERPALVFGNLEIRPDEIQALADGHRVGLTVREFQVLAVLVMREDRVVRRADIYREVWGGEMKHRDRSVDVFVRKVRNKLARAAPGWSYIHTHFGVGYRFAAMPAQERPAGEPEDALAQLDDELLREPIAGESAAVS